MQNQPIDSLISLWLISLSLLCFFAAIKLLNFTLWLCVFRFKFSALSNLKSAINSGSQNFHDQLKASLILPRHFFLYEKKLCFISNVMQFEKTLRRGRLLGENSFLNKVVRQRRNNAISLKFKYIWTNHGLFFPGLHPFFPWIFWGGLSNGSKHGRSD